MTACCWSHDVERVKALPENAPQAQAGGVIGYQIQFRFPEDLPLLAEHMRRGWTVDTPAVTMQALIAINEKLDRLLAVK